MIGAIGIVAALLAANSLARAEELSIALGGGNLRSHGEAAFVAWRRPAASLLGSASYAELALGAWSGPDGNEAVTLSRGVRVPVAAHYFSASLGLGYVAERTERLGTHLQFVARLAFSRPLGDYELAIAQRHYSNGQLLFGWSGPNRGENFLGLELARRF